LTNAGQTIIKRFLDSGKTSFQFSHVNQAHLNTTNILWDFLRGIATSEDTENWKFLKTTDGKAVSLTAVNETAGVMIVKNIFNKQGKEGKTSKICLI